MEHLIINELGDGYVHITAEEGFKVYSLRLSRSVREAVVKAEQIHEFIAVAI